MRAYAAGIVVRGSGNKPGTERAEGQADTFDVVFGRRIYGHRQSINSGAGLADERSRVPPPKDRMAAAHNAVVC